MNKVLYTLLAVSIIFAACKKEDEDGCMDTTATNYNEIATVDDGSCTYTTVISGCTDSTATNYNPLATIDDGSCILGIVGVWTPTSASGTQSMSVTVMGQIVDSFDTTFTMTSADPDWEFTDVEFTTDGKMYNDLDTNSYTYSGNVLTITEDGESETQTCTVTSTSLTVIFSETETYTEDYMGQEATITESSDMTLNATRQ